MLFMDEKFFMVDRKVNRCNNRFLLPARDMDVQAIPATKHPSGVMVFGLVASDGKVMPLIFIDAGLKINAVVHQERVLFEGHSLAQGQPWGQLAQQDCPATGRGSRPHCNFHPGLPGGEVWRG